MSDTIKFRDNTGINHQYNVCVTAYEADSEAVLSTISSQKELSAVLLENRIISQHRSHNVFTNNGRTWLRNLSGAASYASIASNGYIEGTGDVLTSERAAYVAFGVGGALSSAPYYHTQEELVSVTALEDYVLVTGAPTYLASVLPQNTANGSFPDAYTLRLSCVLVSSQVSFAGNVSKSGNVVGTSVPVSEVGLYLSGADATLNLDDSTNTSRLIAYDIFETITVTDNVVLRVDWDLMY